GRLAGNGFRALREVRAALAASPTERVLDFGCGTGLFCLAVPGEYVGIDLDPAYVAFASWRWGNPRRRFEVVDLAHVAAGAAWDAAMMVNCVHHLPDDAANDVLARLARLVRSRFVLVDMDPDTSNRLQRFLLDHDRGEFIRSSADLRRLLAPHFRIQEE